MPEFLRVKTVQEVINIISDFDHLGMESIPIEHSYGRVTAEAVYSPEPVPNFSRATMDGYAVRSRDVFGASESLPALLQVEGEVLMGESPPHSLEGGRAMVIATGGMIPSGADAVVMVEHTQLFDEKTVEVTRPAAPGENILGVGEDIAMDQCLLEKGHVLRPQDVAALAAIGVRAVSLFERPRVAIVSTGDEILPVTSGKLPPGKVRDMNTYSLMGLVKEAGGIVGEAVVLKDDPEGMVEKCRDLLVGHDMIILSGGSSVGARDYTLNILDHFPHVELLVSGVAIRPGKPTILARVGKKVFWGLPGHPLSALMVCRLMVAPMLKILQGKSLDRDPFTSYTIVPALLGRPVPSVHGRTDCIPVTLARSGTGYTANPVFGKSAMIGVLVKADGYIVISEHDEGLDSGTHVDVNLFSSL